METLKFFLGHMFVRFVRLLLGNYSLSWIFLNFLNALSDVALNSGGLSTVLSLKLCMDIPLKWTSCD